MSNTVLGQDCCGDRYEILTSVKCKCGCKLCYCRSCYESHCVKIAEHYMKNKEAYDPKSNKSRRAGRR
jgi:hypothetical protein